MTLEADINKFMEEFYGNLPLYDIRESKIINLTNLGTHHFYAHEMAVIDTPVIQRLKYISQLGPVYNVFPTARHTRFEHTLGVTINVNKMWNSLSENGSLSFLGNSNNIKNIQSDLRMSAILHDIGHCPFSHVSEVVLMDFPQIQSEKIKLGAKPHEIFGHYMIKSGVFHDFFDDLNSGYNVQIDTDKISGYILGNVKNPNEDQYLADLINGQYDADKLDYIVRDSDFSGVPLALGIDRLLLSLGIQKIPTYEGEHRKLIIHEKGIMSLEQLLFAKIMLYSSIYHHQKVRALDHMIISILRLIIDQKIEINGYKVTSPIDLLKLDDFDLLKLSAENTEIKNLCSQLKTRRTFKRCLVISPKTIDEKYQNQFSDLIKYTEHPSILRDLNKVLAERIGNGCTEYDVVIDLPMTPNIGETQQEIIKIGNKFLPLIEIFPQKGWLESYMANKWKGHIFANDKYREKACIEGRTLLEEKFGIKFNDLAERNAKILPVYKKQKTLKDFQPAFPT